MDQIVLQAETLPRATATKDTLTHCLSSPEVHSTAIFVLFLASILADLGNRGHPAVLLLHTPLYIHAKSTIAIPLLPSPHKYDSLSLHHLCIQGSYLYSISKLSCLFLLLNSNDKVVEASYFWDHHTPFQIVVKPTEALDTALVVYLSLAIPVLKPEVYRNPGS